MERGHSELTMESEAITLELESSSYKSQSRSSQPDVAKDALSFAVAQPEMMEVVISQTETKVELETSNELESLKFETNDLFPESAELKLESPEPSKLEESKAESETNIKTELVPSKIKPNDMTDSIDHGKKRGLEEEEFEAALVRIPSTDPSCSSDVIRLKKNQFKIGRKSENDEVIFSVFISRFHCEISYDENKRNWLVTNLSSTDTYLNNEHMEQNETREIKEGDVLQLSEADLFKYRFTYIKKEEKTLKLPRLELDKNDLDTVFNEQNTFVETQKNKRNDLEKELNAKQLEQVELKQKLEKLLDDQKNSKTCQEELNNQITDLQKKIEINNVKEIELQQKYKELLDKLEEERVKCAEKIAEMKFKLQEQLRETKREKEKLEMTMVEQMEEWRAQEEKKQQAEWQKKIDDILKEEKNSQTKLLEEKQTLLLKVKQMEEDLKQKEAQRKQQEAAVAAAEAKAAEMAKIAVVPRPPMDMKKCIIFKVGNNKNVKELPVLETIDLTGGADGSSASKINGNSVIEKVNHAMDESLTCSICSELFVRAMTLNCTHTFCRYCIESWIKRRKDCPNCRTIIVSMTRSLAIDNFIDSIIVTLTPADAQKRKNLVEERKKLLAPVVKRKIIKKT